MYKKKFLALFIVACFGICLTATHAFSEEVIIIDPEPDPEIPIDPQEPPPPPPPPLPPPPPQSITAAINVDPDTLNLKSSRQYITVYIELPAGNNVDNIKIDSVKITAINNQAVEAVAALVPKSSAGDQNGDGVNDHLAAKFDYEQVRPLFSAEMSALRIEGEMNDERTFSGEDTIRVIGLDATTTVTPSTEKRFRFALKNHISPGAEIKGALLWTKAPRRNGTTEDAREAWMYKALKKWESILGRLGILRYSSLKKGSGYEWDITEQVRTDWRSGVGDVVVRFDEENGGDHPVLVLIYEGAAADPAVEESPAKQNLRALGRKFDFVKKDGAAIGTIALSYAGSELEGADESELAVYYWDATGGQWVKASGSAVDYGEKTVTFEARYSASYQVMAPQRPAPVPPAESRPNSLGQNYPNPFNPGTTIEYSIAGDCHVTLKLYNTAGELVATIVDEYQQAGRHSVYYDGGESLARGIYFYQLKAGDFVDTKRMVVLK